MRLSTWTLFLSLLFIGCTALEDEPVDVGTREQGLVELRIDARAMLAANITQVTLEAGGQSQDLVLNQATQMFDGTMILPAGPHTLLARAFSGAMLVGASNPHVVMVQVNQVTRIIMNILDVTGSAPPVYGPILDSLVFPTTAQAATSVNFTASVVAPAGDPVEYSWSSTCSDSEFSAPSSATTSWSKPTQGSCTITMIATSNGYGVGQSFPIVVFPGGSGGSGALDVSARFITAPGLYLSLNEVGCFVSPGGNSSCPSSITSPNASYYSVTVTNWGGSTAGSITVSDNCGGNFGTSYNQPENRSGFWLPPVGGGVCIITATAINADGLATTLNAAILARPGMPPTSPPAPTIFGQLFPSGCIFSSSAPGPVDCGFIPGGTTANVFSSISWDLGLPGSVTLTDNCNGVLTQPDNAFNFGAFWSLPSMGSQTCILTVRATNLQGGMSEARVQVQL
jgi:hypothetical protein